MKTIAIRTLVLAAVLSAATGAALARSSVLLDLGRQAVVTSDAKPATADAVRKAIIAGGSVHNWQPVSDKPGVLTLAAEGGSHRAVVDVTYDAQSYQITYKDSTNLNYAHSDKNDRDTIHPKYNRWVQDLNSAIRSALLVAPTQAN